MEYSESFEQATEFAQSAVELMKEKGISPNPNNFTVWFHYFSGKYPDLKKTLDILLDNEQEFTDERSAELFQKFFTFDEEGAVVSDTAGKVEGELKKILEYLENAENGAIEYGKALAEVTGQMAADDDGSGDLRSVLGKLVHETRAMAERNRGLEEKLSASSDEITQLKEDLENVRREAMTDALTGIANRKLFDVTLRREAMQAMEEGTPLCLLMLDIDYFKKFNDTYGHQIGDQVLKLLGATLTQNVKGKDTPARYGGEEFCVILPNTDLESALKVGDNIRTHISRKRIVNRKTGQDLGKITVSVGAGSFVYGEPLAQFMGRADQALYAAKRQGRNQVVSEKDVENAELEFDH